MELENIVLGSGNLYITDFVDTIPENTEIEVEENLIGRIKGGANLEYKPSEYSVNDDSNVVSKRFVISEEVTFKSGVLTWNVATLGKLIATGSFADNTTTKIRTLKLGGKGAREMKQYLVHFVHASGKVRVTMVATASNGFSLAFAPDKETVVDAEFKAVAHDADGTQLIVTEDYNA